jgi:hypothetical protein
MKYVCFEKDCYYEGEGKFFIHLKGELCVDMNNIATIFCPYCRNVKVPEDEIVQVYDGESVE